MRIGIVGGRLQGMEAAYLCREAQYETVVLDKDPNAAARFLADEFHCIDLLRCSQETRRSLLRDCTVVIPATENHQVLVCLDELATRGIAPVALDLPAYELSASKTRSNELLGELDVALPTPWPKCGFPAIVKPSTGSGSHGVRCVVDEPGLRAALGEGSDATIVQKYLRGPSYSLEVLADRGICRCLQVTELEVDSDFDCKRVLVGPEVGKAVAASLCDTGERIASGMGLSGIMDIEVVATSEGLQVLEIDARLPSQTPSAVYHSTGLNIVVLLAEYWAHGALPPVESRPARVRGVVYEHYRFHEGILEVVGERVLSHASGLRCYADRFSADRLITNWEARPESWVATAIYVGEDETRAWEARNRGVMEIQAAFAARELLDPSPPFVEGRSVDPTHP